MADLEFANASGAWWVPVAGLAVLLALLAERGRRRLIERYADPRLIFPSFRPLGVRRARLRLLLLVGGMALLVFGLAGPTLSGSGGSLDGGPTDVAAVVDVSRSMATEDVQLSLSRLDAAKEFLLRLVEDLRGNRLALVTYAREPYLQAPLTGDVRALRFVLGRWVRVESAPAGGSNLTAALDLARRQLQGSLNHRVLLLLSDGGFSSREDPTFPLLAMSEEGVRVLVVGVGGVQEARIPRYDPQGRFLGWYVHGGREVTTALDEAFLRRLALAAGGRYELYSPHLEPSPLLSSLGSEVRADPSRRRSIAHIPLGLALALVLGHAMLARLA